MRLRTPGSVITRARRLWRRGRKAAQMLLRVGWDQASWPPPGRGAASLTPPTGPSSWSAVTAARQYSEPPDPQIEVAYGSAEWAAERFRDALRVDWNVSGLRGHPPNSLPLQPPGPGHPRSRGSDVGDPSVVGIASSGSRGRTHPSGPPPSSPCLTADWSAARGEDEDQPTCSAPSSTAPSPLAVDVVGPSGSVLGRGAAPSRRAALAVRCVRRANGWTEDPVPLQGPEFAGGALRPPHPPEAQVRDPERMHPLPPGVHSRTAGGLRGRPPSHAVAEFRRSPQDSALNPRQACTAGHRPGSPCAGRGRGRVKAPEGPPFTGRPGRCPDHPLLLPPDTAALHPPHRR